MRKMNLKWWWMASLVAGVSVLGGCDLDPDPETTSCTTNEGCEAGEICTDEGICLATLGEACADDLSCAAGQTCDGATAEAAGECVADACDGACTDGFACDQETGACFETCAEVEGACMDGYLCVDDACLAEGAVYTYAAVLSETTVEADLSSNTPGPDIDAIMLTHGGETFFAVSVDAWVQGAGGDDDGNANQDQQQVLGANDAIPADSQCVLDAAPDGLFWSMGDSTGVVVVKFDRPILDGDTITVFELSTTSCENVSVERADQYAVALAPAGTDLSRITSASDIGDGWLHLGSSGGSGGTEPFTVDLPTE